jgi:C4-dicarboxylate-specific signal transduction histidine kinase
MKQFKFEYKITIAYLIIGCSWILFSDKILDSFFEDPDMLTMMQTFKGWFYVLITGLLFYFFLKIHLRRLRFTEAELEKHKSNLQKLVEEKTSHLDAAMEELKRINDELHRKSDIINSQNSELKETLRHLKEAQVHLLQAEKMASLGILTAGIAHEINNPLNFILGGYTGLEQYFNENGIKDQTVDILMGSIKTGVERSAAIVSGLTQFSSNDKEYEVKCNIHMIIENCLLMLNSQIKDHVEVVKNFMEEPVFITGNVGKLHQALSNILLNACQAIEDRGSVTITTRNSESWLDILITDTGTGIRPDDLPRVTEPFFTTRDPGIGTGLGLSISYSIIKDHKGKLEIESEPDKGTTVKIRLPL